MTNKGRKTEVGDRKSEDRRQITDKEAGSMELGVGWVEPVPGLMGFAITQPILRKRGIGTALWEGRNPSPQVN